MTRRCSHCLAPAVYEARLDYDFTPYVLLCESCARWERSWGSVLWIRSLPRRNP